MSAVMDLWRETRETINHLDKSMDNLRLSMFTLFTGITSVAAALYHYAPTAFVGGLRLSAIVELSVVLAILPLVLQGRLYHLWLFNGLITALNLEDLIYSHVGTQISKKKLMLTYSLTKLESPPEDYWTSMKKSKLFWAELFFYVAIAAASLLLSYAFR